jgi:hypothetical protein
MSFRKRSVRNGVMAELVIPFSLLLAIIHFSSSFSSLLPTSSETKTDSSKEQRYWLKKEL